MIFIEGKLLKELYNFALDTVDLLFEFDLPNGEEHTTVFSTLNDSSTECWAAYDEEKEKIAHFIRSRKSLKQAKAKIESEKRKVMRKELRKEMKSDVVLHYLPNSTVPDDEDYDEFYEDETCYSDEELDELEEKYFW